MVSQSILSTGSLYKFRFSKNKFYNSKLIMNGFGKLKEISLVIVLVGNGNGNNIVVLSSVRN